jgi:WD40 repeat protein
LTSLNNGQIASSFDDNTIKITNDLLNFQNYSTLTGHTDLINTLVQLDNFTLASGSCDQTIKIWNLTSMSLINTLQNNTNCINSLISINLDSNYLLSGSRAGTVQVWSNDYQVIYQKLFNQPVQSIAYFNQFRQLAIAGYSNYFVSK